MEAAAAAICVVVLITSSHRDHVYMHYLCGLLRLQSFKQQQLHRPGSGGINCELPYERWLFVLVFNVMDFMFQ